MPIHGFLSNVYEPSRLIAGVVFMYSLCINTILMVIMTTLFCIDYFTVGDVSNLNMVIFHFCLFCATCFILVPALWSIHKESSLRAEIVGDFKIIKSMFTFSNRGIPSRLLALGGYISLYHLVLPLMFYSLIKYRHLKTFALDTSKFDFKVKSAPMITYSILEKYINTEHVSKQDFEDHFIALGKRYFLKNNESALYIRLKYSERQLLAAINQDEGEILSTLSEASDEGGLSSYDNSYVNRLVKSSFTIC